jgi:hypothetical protein
MSTVAPSLIRNLEVAIATLFEQLGLDTSSFVVMGDDGEPGFREGGSPGEWRGNLNQALKVLYEFDSEHSKEPWSMSVKGYPLRETMLSVINAMKRSDDASLA